MLLTLGHPVPVLGKNTDNFQDLSIGGLALFSGHKHNSTAALKWLQDSITLHNSYRVSWSMEEQNFLTATWE